MSISLKDFAEFLKGQVRAQAQAQPVREAEREQLKDALARSEDNVERWLRVIDRQRATLGNQTQARNIERDQDEQWQALRAQEEAIAKRLLEGQNAFEQKLQAQMRAQTQPPFTVPLSGGESPPWAPVSDWTANEETADQTMERRIREYLAAESTAQKQGVLLPGAGTSVNNPSFEMPIIRLTDAAPIQTPFVATDWRWSGRVDGSPQWNGPQPRVERRPVLPDLRQTFELCQQEAAVTGRSLRWTMAAFAKNVLRPVMPPPTREAQQAWDSFVRLLDRFAASDQAEAPQVEIRRKIDLGDEGETDG